VLRQCCLAQPHLIAQGADRHLAIFDQQAQHQQPALVADCAQHGGGLPDFLP